MTFQELVLEAERALAEYLDDDDKAVGSRDETYDRLAANLFPGLVTRLRAAEKLLTEVRGYTLDGAYGPSTSMTEEIDDFLTGKIAPESPGIRRQK